MFCEGDAKSYGCDIFPVHLCHVLLCHLCICVHFRRALESQAKRCFHICHHIGLHRFAHWTLNPHIPRGDRKCCTTWTHFARLEHFQCHRCSNDPAAATCFESQLLSCTHLVDSECVCATVTLDRVPSDRSSIHAPISQSHSNETNLVFCSRS